MAPLRRIPGTSSGPGTVGKAHVRTRLAAGKRYSARASAWNSLDHLPHLDQPGTAPWLSFGLADGVPADRVAACSIALKLNGGQRDRMRAGRPRSQAMPSRRCGRGCLAGDFSESRRAPFGKLPFAREPDASPGRQPTHLPTPLPPASFPIPRLSAPTPLSEGAPANGQSC